MTVTESFCAADDEPTTCCGTSRAHGAKPQKTGSVVGRLGGVITGRCVACPAELVEAIIEMESGWEPYAYLPRCRGAHAN